MPMSSTEPEEGRVPGKRPDLLAGQHLPLPPLQERSRQKREAVLRAALTLFGEQGYEQTSIESITRQAGVAVGGFYRHFASKRQVLLVLMDRLLQEASQLTWEATSTALPALRDGLAQLFRQALQVDWAYAGAYRAWREAAVRDRELRALHQQIEGWTAQQLAFLFQVLLLMPGARHGVDHVTLAWEVSLLLLRLAEIPLQEPDAVVASLTNLVYHGLFADAPA